MHSHNDPASLDEWLHLVSGLNGRPVTGFLLFVDPPKDSPPSKKNFVLVLKGVSLSGPHTINQKVVAAQLQGTKHGGGGTLRFCSKDVCEETFGAAVARPLAAVRKMREKKSAIDGNEEIGELVIVVEDRLLQEEDQELLFFDGNGATLALPARSLLSKLHHLYGDGLTVSVVSLEKSPKEARPEDGEKGKTLAHKAGHVHRYKETPCYLSQVTEAKSDENDVFEGLNMSPQSCLEEADREGRVECPNCRKPGKFYCTKCLAPMLRDLDSLPKVMLPLQVDIIKHDRERSGKTTSFHAKILAPSQVRLIDFPFPEDDTRSLFADYAAENTVVLFPGPQSVRVGELAGLEKVTRVLVLDATWTSVSTILSSEALKGLRQVKLEPQQAHFWRLARHPTHVSTIEAIWHFFRDYQDARAQDRGTGKNLDDLLFFFAFFYRLVGRHMLEREIPGEENMEDLSE
jgi:DTW domain-containing protein YfiP